MDDVITNNQEPNENLAPVNRSDLKANPTIRKALQDISNTKGVSSTRSGNSSVKSSTIVSSSSHVIPSSNHPSPNSSLPHIATSEDAASAGTVNGICYSHRNQHLLISDDVNTCVTMDTDAKKPLKSSPLFTDETDIDTVTDCASDNGSCIDGYGSLSENLSRDSHLPNETTSIPYEESLPEVEPVPLNRTGVIPNSEDENVKQLNPEMCSGISVARMEELDEQDVSMVSEYSDEIFSYMRELELKMLPSHDYIDRQPELRWHMRRILLDWIVQVHERFRMLPETLFLCVNYVDRFLSVKEVSTDKLQLVGITALFIAAKYEELDAPTVSSMVYMTDQTYTREELQKAERFMINLLNYELGFPGPLNFLRRISKSDEYDPSIRTVAKYLVEVTIMYECFVSYPPSLIAASCYYSAMKMLQKNEWTSTHIHYSGYQEASLICCTGQLLQCLEDPSLHMSVYNKYETSKHMNASQYIAECLASYRDSKHSFNSNTEI